MNRRARVARNLAFCAGVAAALAGAYELALRGPEAGKKTGTRVRYYVDPMHPSYKSDRPGIAPDCGMKLQPVFDEDEAGATAPSVADGDVQVERSLQQRLGIRVAEAEENRAGRTLRVAGRVIPEDARIYRINSGVDGFIRETFNDSAGTLVSKNQRLATFYSPEFLAAASGFLAANERVTGSVSKEGARSIQNYTDRLRNLGIGDAQIQRIAASRQLPESVDIVAPTDGFILSRDVSPGQHFTHGIEFYRLADLARVWVAAEVFEQEASGLTSGAPAWIVIRGAGRRLPAKITASLPQSEAGGGTVKIRLEVENPSFVLRPDMLVDVEIPVRHAPAVVVPLDALVESGERARVYVEREDGTFEPREVETGERFGEQVVLTRGVRARERVVVSATFLIDSESRLRAVTPVPGKRKGNAGARGSSPGGDRD